MHEKLTKCRNFTWYLPKNIFPEFWRANAPSAPSPTSVLLTSYNCNAIANANENGSVLDSDDDDSLLAHSKNELIQWRGVRRLSVCLSVRLSVNFCANRFFSQANGRIATKLSQDGLQVSLHPGCAQGQGQRSRDTRTFLDYWNELLRHWRSGWVA